MKVMRVKYLENGVEKTVIVRGNRHPLVLLENPATIEVDVIEASAVGNAAEKTTSQETSRKMQTDESALLDKGGVWGFLKSALDAETVFLFLLLFTLNVLDVVLTYYAVNAGIASELNPLYNPCDPLPIGKLVAPLIFFCSWLLSKHFCQKYSRIGHVVGKIADYALFLLVGICIAVVANNVAVLVSVYLQGF